MEDAGKVYTDQDLVNAVEKLLSTRELRFARGLDGRITERYALEIAIDVVGRRAAVMALTASGAGIEAGRRAA